MWDQNNFLLLAFLSEQLSDLLALVPQDAISVLSAQNINIKEIITGLKEYIKKYGGRQIKIN